MSIASTTTLKAIAYRSGYTNSAVRSGTYTLKVATPAFSPVAGTYAGTQTVTISTATSGATIRYTTDGSTPTTTSGTVYSNSITLSATATLKAIAYKTGYTNSTVASGVFTITAPAAAAPTFSPVAGTYTSSQTVTIGTTTSGATIRYTTDGSTPSATAGTVYSGPVTISSTTTLKAIAYASGYSNSTVTSGTYTINLPTVATPTFSPVAGTYTGSQTVTIATATSGATIRYTTDGSTPSTTAGTIYSGPLTLGATSTLKAIAYLSGYNNSTVASGSFIINLPTAATPVFSPIAGTYTSVQTVSISTATSGATIRYTTNGTTPTTTTGTVYAGPITISATQTLKAIAYLSGYNNSSVASGTFTINLPRAATPEFSPGAGTYGCIVAVEITTATSDASIVYTTDGTTPAHSGTTITNGTLYSGPVLVEATTALKALAFLSGYADSTVRTGTYTLELPQVRQPVVSPLGGTYASAQSIGMAMDPELGAPYGVLIAYTTDGSDPTARSGTLTHGAMYTEPFSISTPATVKAISYAPNYAPSPVVTRTYTFGPAAATPVFSPPAGTYSGPQNVTISSSTSGAAIVYTTDGSTPTPSFGTPYTGPIPISGTTMLKAVAFVNDASGFSQVADGLYDIASAHGAVVNVLHDFNPSNRSGFGPWSSLIQAADGGFYGTTVYGGVAGKGSVYRMSLLEGFSTLVEFTGLNGASPMSSLVQGADGSLYGTTNIGGTSDKGTIFKVTPSGDLSTLYSFSGPDGSNPNAALTKAVDGNFYGSTLYGGDTSGYGTLFRVTPAGGLTTLKLKGTDTEMFQSTDGYFYGLDSKSSGEIFRLSTTGWYGISYSFPSDSIGLYPQGLALGIDGNFYGTTLTGLGNYGTVFRYTPAGVLTTLGVFDGTNGANPLAGLVVGTNGNFYGTTSGGWDGAPSTLFKATPSGVLTNLYTFNDMNGYFPWSGLIQGSDGNFYGTTSQGGLYNLGTIFQLIIPTTAAPALNPPPGAYYSGVQPITITTTTPGATIRYTTDGSVPTATSGTEYVGPVSLSTSTTLKAIASAPGLDDSPITNGTYFMAPPVEAPVLSPAPGTYTEAQTVTLTSGTAGALIRYTTDSSVPSATKGTLYAGPISVTKSTTISAIAYNPANPDSSVVIGNYVINKPPVIIPSATANGSIFGSTVPVTFTFTATDSDGAITRIEVYRNGSLVNTLTNPTTGSTWVFTESAGLAPGVYTYTAFAFDTQGVSTASSSVMVTVLPGLPYSDGFESTEGYALGSLDGQKYWKVRSGAAQIIDTTAAGGSKAVLVEKSTSVSRVEQAVAVRGLVTEPIYVDLYAKPVVGTDANLSSMVDLGICRLSFILNGDKGQVAVFSGIGNGISVWKPLPVLFDIDASRAATEWHRITLRFNRYNGFYDAYWNGRMVANDCVFQTNSATDALLIAVQGALTADALFDSLSVGLANPLFSDANNDGVADSWENLYGLPVDEWNRSYDPDYDDLVTVAEYIFGSDPTKFDTGNTGKSDKLKWNEVDSDSDGIPDGLELTYGLNPLLRAEQDPRAQADDDGDGLSNYEEIQIGTDPTRTDTDYDRIPDGWEVRYGLSPTNSNSSSDTDGDGRTDYQEYLAGTDPTDPYNGNPPPAPTITRITGASLSVALTWSPMPSMVSAIFEIERRSGTGEFSKVGEIARLSTFVDRTVQDKQSYTYRVRVKYKGGWSPYSSELSVTTQAFPRAGLKVWLDANSCTPGPVNIWQGRNDPTMKAEQPQGTQQPFAIAGVLNGFPVVRFDGLNDSLSLPNVMEGTATGEIFGVVKVNRLSDAVINRLWSFGTATGSAYFNNSRYEDFGTNEDNPHTSSPLSNQYHITNVSLSSGRLVERTNYIVNWIRDGASIAFNPSPTIGASVNNGLTVFDGDIAEILVFNRELSASERLLINRYLADKYALPSVPVPTAPLLSAQAGYDRKVLLSWSAAPSTLYTTTMIERSVSGGGFVALAEVEQGSSYVDSSVVSGGNYSYRVRVIGLSGESAYSNTVSLIVPISTTIVSATSGSNMNVVSGSWMVNGDSIVAQSIRGALGYNIQVESAGLYALDVVVHDSNATNPTSDFVLDVVLDGIPIGTLTIRASGTESGMGHLILPWLTTGTHTIKLVWRNGRASTLISIDSLRLVRLDSTDADNDGEPDWLAPYFQGTFAFDSSSVDSYVSPYTVEGKSAFPLFTKLNSVLQIVPAPAATEVNVKQGLVNQFYADVQLSSTAPVRVTAIEANGLRTGTKIITWKALNLVNPSLSALVVRKDSRLLVEATNPQAPTATYQLKIVTPTGFLEVSNLASSEKREVLFDQIGNYRMYLTPAGGAEIKVLDITVRHLSLSPVPTLFVGSYRVVPWGNLPLGPTVQTDPTLNLTVSNNTVAPQTFLLTAYSTSRAILRLDGENGPIVDAVTVDPIRSYNDEQATFPTVGTLSDGTSIYRFVINFEGAIPADLRIVLRFFTGVTFKDGSTEKIVTAADIDSSGRFSYYVYAPNGVTASCHSVYIYSGSGELLYSY